MTREEFLKRWSEIEKACETYDAEEVDWVVHPKMFELLMKEFGTKKGGASEDAPQIRRLK